ncbi:MAG TPA: hypothetical protein VE907_06750 [Gammaproteobacteria bacterium]|nr:hypothetical protein [Gammaproteobacteria bacterium]
MRAQVLRFVRVAAAVLVWSVAGADSPDRGVEQEVPLTEAERLQITLSLLEQHPELASSPGVKAAGASLGGPGPTDGAYVVFYPHTDSHGIKEAFQAFCLRKHGSQTWTCNDVTIRRYVSLPSQDFEVRVTGDISFEATLALIEASRRDLQAGATQVVDLPSTAIIILPLRDGGYLIDWGTREGYAKLTMRAELAEGGDSADPDAWHARIVEFPAPP